MALNIPVELAYAFNVKASAHAVFDLLSDVPRSARHYPKVSRLVDLGDSAYRWEMEKLSLSSVSFQTVYASRYVANRANGSIAWTAVEGVGNAQISGQWSIKAGEDGTHIRLLISAQVSLPLPGLMRAMAATIVESELRKETEQYIANLVAQLQGEA